MHVGVDRFVVLVLTSIMGGAMGQEAAGGGKRPCVMDDLMPCINGAVAAYVRNTRGPDAQQTPLDAQEVGIAMSARIDAADYNINRTCGVMMKTDPVNFLTCMNDLNEKCNSQPTEADLQNLYRNTAPVFRETDNSATLNQLKDLCTPGCQGSDFNQNVFDMTLCWNIAEESLQQALATNVTAGSNTCNEFNTYVQCQWDKSLGCDFLMNKARRYFTQLTTPMAQCEYVLPAAAVYRPPQETVAGNNDDGKSKAAGLLGSLWRVVGPTILALMITTGLATGRRAF